MHCRRGDSGLLQKSHRRSFATWPKIYPKRIRVITCDITGTLVSFRGSLEQHYLGSAQSCGVDLSTCGQNGLSIQDAFKQSYQECTRIYPCFGGQDVTAKEWWRKCVLRSFELAGIRLNENQQDAVFQRIYSVFGSQKCYEKFDDAMPFLHWANRNHVVCGVLSNADERYGDSILPMLGFRYDDLQLQCFSKDIGYEKPSAQFFHRALQNAQTIIGNDDVDPLLPSQVLHIGNDYQKDFEGARRVGWHAILLSRYNEPETAAEWKRRGALVFEDLLDVVEVLGRSNCRLG